MKKLSLFALSLLLSLTAFAQQPASKEIEPKTPEERAKFQTEKMESELQLTAAQKEEVYNINLGIAQKNEGIRTSNFSEEEKRSIIKSNREAQIEMLKNILTAAQFEKMKAEMKDHSQGGNQHQEKHWSIKYVFSSIKAPFGAFFVAELLSSLRHEFSWFKFKETTLVCLGWSWVWNPHYHSGG